MSLSVSLLPLRTTDPQQDLAGMLSTWMDNLPLSSLGLRSETCRNDLNMLSDLRQSVAKAFPNGEAYQEALQSQDDIHQYYHYLLECENKGLKENTTAFSQQLHRHEEGGHFLSLEWESALTRQIQSLPNSLEWDRAGIIWNLVTLEVFQATQQSFDDKAGWNKAAQHFQNAASWLQYLPTRDVKQEPVVDAVYPDFSETFVDLWQSLLVAQSQRCVYESLACAPKPRHLLLAKLAAAAVPLFANVESIVQKDDESAAPSLTPFSNLVACWTECARAYGIFMSCKAEFHQSQLSREKKQWGQELARLDLAYQYAAMCNDFLAHSSGNWMRELHSVIDSTLKDLKERVDKAEQEGHNQPVPTRQELTEIRGEQLVNIEQPLSKLLKPKKLEPIFQDICHGPDIRLYAQLFESRMEERIVQITNLCDERTKHGRQALASVNLPHSLTGYQQEQSGGGLPDELWRRVQIVQREGRIAQLKQDLWELRDVADLARSTFQKISSQLDFDLDSDLSFRKENPGFEGHYAAEVQKAFRESMEKYEQWLRSAQTGDEVLLKKLDQLDTNPKFKLLQFRKTQLDMLLPGANGNDRTNSMFDTTHLNNLLATLSDLFHDRDALQHTLRDSVNSFDIVSALSNEVSHEEATDEIYRKAVSDLEKSFDGVFDALQNNIVKQSGIVNEIMAESEEFRVARARSKANQTGDSCIVMIEDAISEIEELSDQLREGKGFYGVVLPKLEKLKQQVGDVSARLTVERLEFDDRAIQAQQEEKDAMMAQKLSSDTTTATGETGHDSSSESADFDEKVATLVAMDFDPSKVVLALKKHNSDVDQALNELLSYSHT